MTHFAKHVKDTLNTIIQQMATNPKPFVNNPKKDFIRKRKVAFEDVVQALLSMGGSSLNYELLKYFGYSVDLPSASAFIQQRSKIRPQAMQYLFQTFIHSFSDYKRFEGYRILAVDGSSVTCPPYSKDPMTFIQTQAESKPYNLNYLNALYDVLNKVYLDVSIQRARERNEHKALCEMVQRSELKEKVILIADRGYESYNNLAQIQDKGWFYLIRVKDTNSKSILSKTDLPQTPEFDQHLSITLTKSRSKKVQAKLKNPRWISPSSPFDFFHQGSEKGYPLTFRAIRIQLAEGVFQCFLTNLPKESFPVEKITSLYHMRWGIETSFRELKHVVGLLYFHSKKTEYVHQEIYARLIMYNFCELITLQVVVHNKPRKHTYQVNFTMAIRICIKFFKKVNIPPPDVETLILKYTLPVRKGRSFKRVRKVRKQLSFNYRVT